MIMRCKAGSSSATRTRIWRSAPLERPGSSDDASPMPPLRFRLMPQATGMPRSPCRILGSLLTLLCIGLAEPAATQSPTAPEPRAEQEPITPIPAPPAQDPRRLALGEQLFHDTRLSGDNARSCASYHDVRSN